MWAGDKVAAYELRWAAGLTQLLPFPGPQQIATIAW